MVRLLRSNFAAGIKYFLILLENKLTIFFKIILTTVTYVLKYNGFFMF